MTFGFQKRHSLVAFIYFLAVTGFTMTSHNPYFAALSFVCAGIYSVLLSGIRAYGKKLVFYIIVVLVVAAVNCLSSSLGLTLLFRIGEIPITLEALLYGLTSGLMLAGVMAWFRCFDRVMSSDRLISLFGRSLPVFAMMISMVLRYIPLTIRRGKEAFAAQRALDSGKKPGVLISAKVIATLIVWSMESAIETASSMNARGYAPKRGGVFSRERFGFHDALSAAAICVIALLCFVFVFIPSGKAVFYPILDIPKPNLGYIFAVTMFLYPVISEAGEIKKCMLRI